MASPDSNQSKSLLKGAFILTIAALIVKVLSAIYRVPFQNIVGDVGFYIYQQVYPFYGIAIILCTYGFPVIISKLYAEYLEEDDELSRHSLITASVIVLTVIGVSLFLLLYFFAPQIAHFMKDSDLVPLIKAVSFVYLLVPFVALFRGIFQGQANMIPTAVSQVGEQSVRVSAILIVSFILVNNGHSLYVTGAGAMYSSVAGLVISTLILSAFYYKQIRLNKYGRDTSFKADRNQVKRLIKQLFINGSLVCLSGMLLIFFQLADSLNLYGLLVSSGVEELAAKSMKGIYDRGQPLIQLGTVVATSISLALIPFIASAKTRNDKEFLNDKIRLTIELSAIIGVGASAGLALIIVPTNMMLFKNSDGSDLLTILSLIIVFSSMIMTIVAILQGLGYISFPALVIVGGAFLKYTLNTILVPLSGTIGGAVSSILSLLVILILLIIKLKLVTGRTFLSKRLLVTVGSATVLLIVTLKLYIAITSPLYDIVSSQRLAATIQALTSLVIGGLLYIAVIVKSSLLSSDELKLLPFGNKLIKLLGKK